MEKTVLILKRETSKSLKQDPKTVLSLSGYLLKVGVEIAHNIDRNIFVMQRDILSNYSQEQLDTFYSIASVGELEWIPVGDPDSNSSNFFRTDYIELMFESVKDLEDSWKKISGEVFALAESNDLSINTDPDMYAIYPTDSINIYYGNTTSSPSVSEITNLRNTSMYVEDLNITDTFNGLTYFTIAIPIYSRYRKFFIDNVLALHNQNDITLINKYGASIPYKVYTTIEPVPSGLHTILFKE